MVERVIERMGSTVRSWGVMYKAVAQLMLLYGRKIWLVTEEMLKVLTGLHHWEEQGVTGMTARCGAGGEWDYPFAEE